MFRRRHDEPLMPLADALEALGERGGTGTERDVVPLAGIVGSVSRSEDFDRDFTTRQHDPRMRRAVELLRSGSHPPPVDLVRLGGMYFVVDGHHRVAAARALGHDEIPARVRWICTVAYAWACLRAADLGTVAAQRRFLEEVPLPDDVTRALWLDDPSDWERLTDAALAWGYRQHRDADRSLVDAHALASAWWEEAMVPVIRRLRESSSGSGTPLDGLPRMLAALASRDELARHIDGMDRDAPLCSAAD